MFYDLTSDPHENDNILSSDLTNGWMFSPVLKVVGKYEASLKQYPNIKVGEEFTGYTK